MAERIDQTVWRHEQEILALRAEQARLWRYYHKLMRQYHRLRGRLPEGKAWERGSTLTIPPRPVRLLRDLGILKDERG